MKLPGRLRKLADAWARLDFSDFTHGMSKHDRQRWAACRTTDDLGQAVIDWLNGGIIRTPGHLGGPDPETIPLIPARTILNRSGFVTDCSQLAETDGQRAWNTWVDGWADDTTLAQIRKAMAGTDLIIAVCRGTTHECGRIAAWWFCPWHEAGSFWYERCRSLEVSLDRLWYVHAEDPEPGRNDLLWPVLTGALGDHEVTPVSNPDEPYSDRHIHFHGRHVQEAPEHGECVDSCPFDTPEQAAERERARSETDEQWAAVMAGLGEPA